MNHLRFFVLGHVQTLSDADVLRRSPPAAAVDQGDGDSHFTDSFDYGDEAVEHGAVAEALWRTFGE